MTMTNDKSVLKYSDEIIRLSKPQWDIYNSNARFITAVCGRRFGKSFVSKEIVIKESETPNKIIHIVAPVLKQTKKLYYRPLVKALKRIDENLYKNDSDLYIERTNGTLIYFGSGESIENLRGDASDFVLFDETQGFQKYAWSEVFRPMLSDRGGRGLFIGTPKGKSGLFWDLCNENDEDFKHYKFTTADGGRVPKEEIEAAKRLLDERTFRQEYEASFEAYSNTAYYCFSEKNYSTVEYDNTADSFLCFDFNAGECPMSVVLVQRQQSNYYAVKEFSHQNTNTYDICEIINNWLIENNFSGNLTIVGDYSGTQRRSSSIASRTDYDVIDYYFKNYKNYIVRKRPTLSVKDRVNSLNSMLRAYDGTITFYINKNNCPKLIEDFKLTEFLDNGVSLDGRDKMRTHLTDAVSYFAYNFFPKDIKKHIITGN